MKHERLLILFFGLIGLMSCATDYPIKTVRDENQTELPPPDHSTGTATNSNSGNTPVSSDQTPTAISTERKVDVPLTQLEIQKWAYELGLDPKKPLTDSEKKMISDRQHLRELERSLNSNNERVQYSKVLPWLKNDQEKIEMLSIPTIEGRQVWINKNKIWGRAKSLAEFDEVVEAQDIAMGMPTEYVKKSWGEPDHVEVSGNPIYRNERWQYNRQIPTPQGYKLEKRLVYFEGGRVVGWETE